MGAELNRLSRLAFTPIKEQAFLPGATNGKDNKLGNVLLYQVGRETLITL